MPSLSGIVLNFTAKTADATRDIGKLDKKLGGLGGAAKKAGGGIGGALGSLSKIGTSLPVIGTAIAGVAGLGTAFVGMAKSAAADAAAADKLARSLKKSTKATDEGVAAAEAWINQMQFATGIADDDLRPALERAARSTKNMGQAQKLVKLGMDISARTGKPLATVMRALAKANDGNIKALKGLGLTLGDNAENASIYAKEQGKLLTLQGQASAALDESGAKSKTYKDALARVADQQKIVNGLAAEGIDWQKELSKEFTGAAAAAGGTVQGTFERIGIIFAEMGEAIGTAALPLLEDLAAWFGDKANTDKIQEWIGKLETWATTIGESIRGKVEDFVNWLKSDAGKQAIKDITQAVKDLGKALETVVGWLSDFKGGMTWLIDHMPGGKDGGWADDPRNFFNPKGGGLAPDAPGSHLNPDQNKGGRPPIPRNAAASYNGGGGVVININNPKPERASTSVAASLRVSRTNTGVWT